IANDYANQGVAAEDRKDPYSAVIAYRHAIEWNPNNSKARFNLGAIYIDDKRYDLAEKEYRALVQADAADYEALYWLGQSILAQRPGAERTAEACGLLRRSLAVADPQKKLDFGKAVAAAKCP
ncbi:MAG TPA: tetratricopeptide repeat protein, partial [Bryobacteraceae bacterium]|nr:tetratricopeptide repeat protein [Bryobacteraceae bacterium]